MTKLTKYILAMAIAISLFFAYAIYTNNKSVQPLDPNDTRVPAKTEIEKADYSPPKNLETEINTELNNTMSPDNSGIQNESTSSEPLTEIAVAEPQPKLAGAPSLKSVSLAQCITSSGAKFYGAFWCSHCQAQKELFADDAKYLPYIECSSPDGKGQLQVCAENNIGGYPTWVFNDGSSVPGTMSLEQLSAKTGCAVNN